MYNNKPKVYSDAEKAAYFKKKFAAAASGAALAAAKKKPTKRYASASAVDTLPGSTTPGAPMYKQVVSKRTRSPAYPPPRGYDKTYAKGTVRNAQNPKKSKMESISHLVEMQGFDKDKFGEDLDNRLKERSLYYQSLLDPMQGAGAKVPDLTAIPTATFQMVQRVTTAANAGGLCGLRVPSPQFASANATVATQQYAGYQGIAAAATVGAISWGAVVDWAGFTSFGGSVSFSRCVSAALYAEFIGTELQDSGQFTCQFGPGAFASPTTLAQLENFPYSSITPVNRNTPVMVRYIPQGFFDLPFVNTGNGITSDWGSHTDSMIIIVSGIPAGSQVVFTFVGNYEFQPSSQSVNLIDTMPSPSDPVEISKVGQWAQEIETSGLVPAKYVDITPSAAATNKAEARVIAHEEQDSLGGLGMLGDILDFAIPTLMKVVPMLL